MYRSDPPAQSAITGTWNGDEYYLASEWGSRSLYRWPEECVQTGQIASHLLLLQSNHRAMFHLANHLEILKKSKIHHLNTRY